ncbi:hypothetical protein NF700_01480 [Sphingomonadaceae bacterium OTU29MARTA1]|uniref:hypothetical protein n=1 Tax=Sphingomonas sp. Leaf37 TaxID=2876552 RepID=UPI001E40D536|nr:hypothetical protein [Sphingomonas sp. Leaf37]USU05338.1 hypothetical protein NF699_01130 [Sphingomonadaceae bacterium OTU29LAMAA1]USU09013.1 hypothetical protein NF700_01480 [Sphingomonadaceae bacterium OTU29MARTA1]
MSGSIAAALLMTIGAVATAPVQPTADTPLQLRTADVGRLIAARVGQEVRIVLPPELGTGYYWRVRPDAAYTVVDQVDARADPDQPTRDAAIIRIAFARPGDSVVVLDNVPQGGGGGRSSNQLKYRFTVAP